MMEKSKVSLFTLVVLSVVGLVFLMTNWVNAAVPADTVSYWKLDEATQTPPGEYTEEINANDGACAAGGCPDNIAGQVDDAQDFDGIDGIDVAAPAPGTDFNWAGDASFSIALWMKRDDAGAPLPDNEVIIGRDDTNPAVATLHWWVGLDSATPVAGEGAAATFVLSDSLAIAPGPGSAWGVVGTTDVADGGWHHIVAVRDDVNGELRLYVDRTLEGTKVVANGAYGTGFNSATDLTMGYMLFGVADFFFEGAIDEVSLYDSAFTQDDVDDHYAAGFAGDGIDTLVPDPVPPTPTGGGGSGGCFINTAAE
ncbi:MAG: LamG domain-containing protein [Pseudomonadota bacterium]